MMYHFDKDPFRLGVFRQAESEKHEGKQGHDFCFSKVEKLKTFCTLPAESRKYEELIRKKGSYGCHFLAFRLANYGLFYILDIARKP